MKLEGNTILITGGSVGIGLALAEEFVKLGNTVIVTGRNKTKLAAAKQKVPELVTIQSDVGDAAAVQKLAKTIASKHSALNVLINNAGVMEYRNLTETPKDLKELSYEIDINVTGPIRMNSALIDVLKANKGTIINVSSGLAYVPLIAMPIYCATKAAIHSYTITLRQQLKGMVEVLELMPPAVRTEMTADLKEEGGFSFLTTEELVKGTISGLRAGHEEIRPGQANQLYWMSRIAPGFIQGQLAKGGAPFVPAAKN